MRSAQFYTRAVRQAAQDELVAEVETLILLHGSGR